MTYIVSDGALNSYSLTRRNQINESNISAVFGKVLTECVPRIFNRFIEKSVVGVH